MSVSRNNELRVSFDRYCIDNPDLRFWQALTNWSGHHYILLCDHDEGESEPITVDPWHFEGKDS